MIRLASVLSRQIVSIFIVVYAVAFWQSASRLPAGPAVTYPRLVIGVLLTFVVVEIAVGSRRALQESDPEVASPSSEVASTPSVRGALSALWTEHHKTFVTTLSTGVYIFVIEPLGFYMATALYLGFLLPYLGVRRLVILVPLWAGALLLTWGLFSVLLSVRLPKGFLG